MTDATATTVSLSKEPAYKYNEKAIVRELLTYINTTYGQHYVGDDEDKTQLMDLIKAAGDGLAFNRWSAIKYLQRFGKKDGMSRKDLLKALHYTVLLVNDLDRATAATKGG